MQRQVAAGRDRRLRERAGRAGQGPHRQIVRHQNPLKPDPPADHLTDHGGRQRPGPLGVDTMI